MSTQRVLSLLPACTEIVCALGCGGQLVGRSHECDFPPEVQTLPFCTSVRLNSTANSGEIDREVKSLLQERRAIYDFDTAQLKALRPDLILTQSQCDVCAVSLADLQRAVAGAGLRAKIVSVAPMRLADVWGDIQTMANALGVPERGKMLLAELKGRVVDVIEKTCLIKKRPGVVCLEWLEPLMGAGNWIPELVDLAGGRNLSGEAGQHSAWMEWETLEAADVLILMPCGFDLSRTIQEARTLQRHPKWKSLAAVKTKRVFATDGNQFFNRPGPRLVDSVEILAEILFPKTFSFGHEGKGWRVL